MAGLQSIFSSPLNAAGQAAAQVQKATPAEAQKNFAEVLKETIGQVNNAQTASDALTARLAAGENVELHEVMIASQKAGITLQATMEVRNKAVEAYQEIMRMNI